MSLRTYGSSDSFDSRWIRMVEEIEWSIISRDSTSQTVKAIQLLKEVLLIEDGQPIE